MLKMKNVKMVDVSDFSDLVKETYGKPYHYQQQDGCKFRGVDTIEVPAEEYDYENDSIIEKVNGPEMGVSFQAWLDRDPKQHLKDEPERENSEFDLRLFWHRNFYPHVSMVVNDLYKRGLIEAGEFSIDIDW